MVPPSLALAYGKLGRELGDWGAGWGVMGLSLWETHHEAGASLRAGQLAGARDLAHHQSLELLQLLQESSANTANQNHEGRLRDKTVHGGVLCPGLREVALWLNLNPVPREKGPSWEDTDITVFQHQRRRACGAQHQPAGAPCAFCDVASNRHLHAPKHP